MEKTHRGTCPRKPESARKKMLLFLSKISLGQRLGAWVSGHATHISIPGQASRHFYTKSR